jgi:E3 ubiquitin-protein ligase TRIP12
MTSGNNTTTTLDHCLTHDRTSALSALEAMDPDMAAQLRLLIKEAEKFLATQEKVKTTTTKQDRLSSSSSSSSSPSSSSSLSSSNDPIASLCLDWTLPGRPDVRLMPVQPLTSKGDNEEDDNEEEDDVRSDQLNFWVALVLHHTLLQGGGGAVLVSALRAGFASVCDPASLAGVLSPEELAVLLSGGSSSGSGGSGGGGGGRKGGPLGSDPLAILAQLDCAHGYSASSPAVQALVKVLAKLTPTDQKAFLRFVTGSPRLPLGGLGNLRPRLTVVRKESTATSTASTAATTVATTANSTTANTTTATTAATITKTVPSMPMEDLPSASTCTNYLKLPDYGSEARLRERLLLAIQEGQGAFYLS